MTRPWRDPAVFILLTFAITYALWFGSMALVRMTGVWLEGLAVLGPAVAALWMMRSRGAFRWLGSALRGAEVRLWWALVPVSLLGLAAGAAVALGGPFAPVWQKALFLFVIQTLFAALPEEIGWRAYLTPTLLRFQSPLATSILVGVTWGFWHAPKLASIPLLPMLCIALSIIMTYACVRLKGGLPLAILIHGSFNAATFWAEDAASGQNAFAMLDIVIAIVTIVALLLVLAKREWFLARPGGAYSNSTMTSST